MNVDRLTIHAYGLSVNAYAGHSGASVWCMREDLPHRGDVYIRRGEQTRVLRRSR